MLQNESNDPYEALKLGSAKTPSMGLIDSLMKNHFGDDVRLTKCHGPVQMCVYRMEYIYPKENYKIVFECERAILAVMVYNEKGKWFWPSMIYPESKYYHDEGKVGDVTQLVELVYKAINTGDIIFK